MTDNATKQANHRVARKALLRRCVIKELEEGKGKSNFISEADMEKARAEFMESEAARRYKEAMDNVRSKINEKIPGRYRTIVDRKERLMSRLYVASPNLTPEKAVEALCAPKYKDKDKEYANWIASYLHENLKRLKRLRNRPHMHKGIMESWLTGEVSKYGSGPAVGRVVTNLMRWLYPTPTERDYFYPTTYAELKRGRVSTYAAGGGRLYSTEHIDIVGRHPSEVGEVKAVAIRVD